MGRSEYQSEHRQFIEDNDVLNIYNEIKEMFKEFAFGFDDLLSKMGKPGVA